MLPKLYRRPGGWLFHTNPKCPHDAWHLFVPCTENDIRERKLFPCTCTENSRTYLYQQASKIYSK